MNTQIKDLANFAPPPTFSSHSSHEFTFHFTKSIISKSSYLDSLGKKFNLQAIPEIVFGENCCQIINEKKNFVFEVNPIDCLKFCNFKFAKESLLENFEKTEKINGINYLPGEVTVKHYEIWKDKKPVEGAEIKELEKISDCFYSTPYKGTIKSISPSSTPYLVSTTDDIPLSNLRESNPILWSDMIPLFEDELGDNGLVSSEFRLRVMGDCFFGLLRTYLRVDDVLIRIFDTRIYHKFGEKYILREFTVKEDSYENIKKKGFKFTPAWGTDPGQSFLVSDFLSVKYNWKEKIVLEE